MKRSLALITLSIVLLGVGLGQESENPSAGFPILNGPYLGQEPPGTKPELFAPGVISREDHFEHSAAMFSPDLREVFWCAKPSGDRYFKMYFMEIKDGRWTAPRVVPFLETNFGEKGPVFSPDGNQLFFNLQNDIWRVERRGDGWTEPTRVTEVSDSTRSEKINTITENGSIYFTRTQYPSRIDEIYVAGKSGEGYSEPVKLGKDFQSGYERIGGVFVAPDESYMILELQLDRRIVGLFVSFKMADDTWSDAVSLSLGWALFPAVSPDGEYLFFMNRAGICWVSAGIIEELKPAELK